jgi:hypothetical protein
MGHDCNNDSHDCAASDDTQRDGGTTPETAPRPRPRPNKDASEQQRSENSERDESNKHPSRGENDANDTHHEAAAKSEVEQRKGAAMKTSNSDDTQLQSRRVMKMT